MVQDDAKSRKCNISLAIRVKLRSQREQQVNGRCFHGYTCTRQTPMAFTCQTLDQIVRDLIKSELLS